VVKQRLPKRELTSAPTSPQDKFQAQLQTLLKQQNYRQALSEIHNAQRSQPDLVFQPSEAEIWVLRGKQEFQKGDFKQADTSLRRALQLGLAGESHYWLAKALLAMNRLDGAIALLRTAFEDGSLPKDYSICYAKLLLLQGDTVAVEQLLSQQAKRFSAAQQHWLRGVLALKAEQPAAALASFQKVKQPLTPGDRLNIWQIYTQQKLQNWEAAALQLGLKTSNMWAFSSGRPAYTEHPILRRLALLQQIETQQISLEQMHFGVGDRDLIELVDVLSLLELVEQNNPHDAVHVLLKLGRSKKYPELETLRPALLTLAGQQALTQGEVGCAAEFWQLLQREQPFNPQLAVNLVKALDLNEDYPELQRLLTRLIKWLEQNIKQHPQNWSEERRKTTLSYAHCRLADTWMAMGKPRAAMGEMQAAERIYPESPEVIGRHGLIAALEDRYDEATRLMTQALEQGCRSAEVYTVLIETLKKLGNSEATLEARRRFGKKFGDLSPEAEVEVLPWVDALSTGSYPLFSRLVEAGSARDPALHACQIFARAVQGEPNSGGNVSLKQSQAIAAWDKLLQGLTPQEQVPTLQAIGLCLLLFAKREKGIAALVTQYMAKLTALGEQQPEARAANLVLLSLKERDAKKLQIPLQSYLGTVPQPGNALAQIQLQMHRYTRTILQDQILRSFIEDALKREPQNPLLLLAKATTYPANSANYEKFRQQGFELARRLQDAKALQAFRDEQALLAAQEAQQFLPDPSRFDSLDIGDMDEMLESMIRRMFGNQIPPAELKRMMPELKQMMLNSLPPDFGDDEDDEDDEDEGSFGFGFPFGGFSPPPSRRSSKRKRR
jgi:tetratricopeptide (TPR) repeat protein